MAWGPFLSLLLRSLPDILFLWRRRVETNDREAIHDDVQEFREALFPPRREAERGPGGEVDGGAALDRAAELLERRVREARDVRQQRAQTDAA